MSRCVDCKYYNEGQEELCIFYYNVAVDTDGSESECEFYEKKEE